MQLRVISWNLNDRDRETSEKQLDLLLDWDPHVVVLQEVTRDRAATLTDSLEAGTPRLHCLDSFACHRGGRNGSHKRGLLLAARFPMTPVPVQVAKLEWPERILACRLEVGGGGLCIVGCYVPPGSSNDWAKVEVLEALYDFVFGIRRGPLIIAGDFNTPREELADGRVVTWAQRLDASGEVRNLTYRKGEPSGRWDRAERSIVQGLPALGYRDVFRSRYRHATKAFSWNKRRKGREIRRRYDHIFASDELKTKSCEYLHSPRARSLSDHAPIRAVFSWMPDSGRDP